MTIDEYKIRISETKREIRNTTGYRRKDLIRHLNKLQRKMSRCKE